MSRSSAFLIAHRPASSPSRFDDTSLFEPVVAFPLSEETNRRTAMAAKFEMSTDKSGKFRFRLKVVGKLWARGASDDRSQSRRHVAG